MNKTNKIKVPTLYIGGWGRSGSTLIGNVLGSLDSFVHLGELVWIWEHGWKSNHLCGCGVRFQSCNFWRKVINDFVKEVGIVDIDKMIYIRNKYFMSNKNFLNLLLKRIRINREVEEYVNVINVLYKSIFFNSGNKIIIDSSKVPFHLLTLRMIDNIKLYLIHLVRDARGCAYSWNKSIYREDVEPGKKDQFVKYDPIFSTIRWCIYNTFFEIYRLGKDMYFRIKYESFSQDPISVLRFISKKIAHENIKDIHSIEIGVNHTVWGNPSRLKRGRVQIRLDDEWRRAMPWKDRMVVTALAWPWLLRYGYFR